MTDEAIALDGFLDQETVPGDLHGTTARFRLIVCQTDERVDEMVLPCTAAEPLLAHAVLHDLRPGDHIRVTGYLHLPRTPDDLMWLNVTALETLAPDSTDDLAAYADRTLPEDGLLERHGTYLLFHDPIGVTTVWSQTGAWVGETEDPDAIGDLIATFEHRTTHGDT